VSFCDELQAEIASLARRADTDEGNKLFVVLERLLERLKNEDRLAYELLQCLSFVGARFPVVPSFVLDYLEVRTGERIDNLALLHVFDVLLRYSLLERRDGVLDENAAGALELHHLTNDLLRDLFSGQADDVARTADSVFRQSMVRFAELATAKACPPIKSIRRWLRRAAKVAESDTLHPASAYYEHIHYARFYSGFITRGLPLLRGLVKEFEEEYKNPDTRLGAVGVHYSGPERPVKPILLIKRAKDDSA
jgi:hypothetical protein